MGGSHGPVLPAVVLVTQLLPIGFFKVSFVAACIVVFGLLPGALHLHFLPSLSCATVIGNR